LPSISIEAHREAWAEAVAAVADETENPAYRGLRISPILGLIPLGRDPDSGLYEFAHLGSGTVPRRDAATGRLQLPEGSAVVLVLVPGGSYRRGAQAAEPDASNYDPLADEDESPVREVSVGAFLIAKHECTQGQWAAMTEGARPSQYGRGTREGDRRITDRHPVERVSFTEARLWLGRHRLRLPTEAEWEYACRAGTDTPWSTGREVARLGEVANLADAYFRAHGGPADWNYTDEVDDGHSVHAPVGSYLPNAFGLHDLHGNVWEWCEDRYGSYDGAPRDGSAQEGETTSAGRVNRGGGWSGSAADCRSSARYWLTPGNRGGNLGLRPAASVR
jgi:formylglycine-generating enzyme required for sulfatase activity